MRATWINSLGGTYGTGEPPWKNPELWKKLKKYNILGVFFDIKDPFATTECLDYFRDPQKNGYRDVVVGLYANPATEHDTPKRFAQRLSDAISERGQNGKQCRLSPNIEYPYVGPYMIDFMDELKAVRPGRDWIWVPEGKQGGWIKSTPGLVAKINNEPRLKAICAEDYNGEMQPYNDDEIRQNLLDAGVNKAKAKICYDGKRLTTTSTWDGCVFYLERLP